MFVRVKSNFSKGAAYQYLQIVRSYREGGKVRQQIIGSLGRRDRLAAPGQLDGLLKSLAGCSEKLREEPVSYRSSHGSGGPLPKPGPDGSGA